MGTQSNFNYWRIYIVSKPCPFIRSFIHPPHAANWKPRRERKTVSAVGCDKCVTEATQGAMAQEEELSRGGGRRDGGKAGSG